MGSDLDKDEQTVVIMIFAVIQKLIELWYFKVIVSAMHS